jgi:hypothetical protein
VAAPGRVRAQDEQAGVVRDPLDVGRVDVQALAAGPAERGGVLRGGGLAADPQPAAVPDGEERPAQRRQQARARPLQLAVVQAGGHPQHRPPGAFLPVPGQGREAAG